MTGSHGNVWAGSWGIPRPGTGSSCDGLVGMDYTREERGECELSIFM
jgi:hypothetical protein